MISFNHAVFGADRTAFDQGQQIALHTFTRDVRAVGVGTPRDLVDLVQEHNAVLLEVVERTGADVFLVDELARLFFEQHLARMGDLHAAAALAACAQILKHAAQLIGHFFHARRGHDLDADIGRGDLDLDFAIFELALAQHLAKALAGRGGVFGRSLAKRARAGQQHVENALLGGLLGLLAHLGHRRFALHVDRDVGQIANDRIDVTPDIADLGKLGRFDLDEGRAGEPCETPRNLGFANPGRADHEDVLGRDLVAQPRLDLRPPPTIAQGDRHRALGLRLADDVFVELLDDFLRSEIAGVHGLVRRFNQAGFRR